jgi:hypothetical protein
LSDWRPDGGAPIVVLEIGARGKRKCKNKPIKCLISKDFYRRDAETKPSARAKAGAISASWARDEGSKTNPLRAASQSVHRRSKSQKQTHFMQHLQGFSRDPRIAKCPEI